MKLSDFDFRVWNSTKKEYLYENHALVKLNSEGILIGRFARQFTRDYDYFYQIFKNEFEIELWTGYCDRNGKKIYEGDILEDKMTMEDLPYKVVFKWGAFYLVEIDGNDEDLMSEFLFMELEVIGNIHENPELLK